MSDEIKTAEETGTPTENGGNSDGITLSQEKLNSLINEKYKKGAEKATADLLDSLGVESVDSLKDVLDAKRQQEEAERTELERASNTIEELTAQVENANKQMSQMQEESKLSALALQNGVQDVDYFKYAYNQAKTSEGFSEESFVNSLKESKPYVFGQSVATPPTDKSGNGAGSPNDLASKVQGLSFSELQKLQNQL